MSIELYRDTGKNVTRKTDARLFDHIFGKFGLLTPCTCTMSGLDKIMISSCSGIICGNDFFIEMEEITVGLAETGTVHGRVVIRLDLSEATNKISLRSEVTTDDFPALEQRDDANEVNGVYEAVLCTYEATETMISDIRRTASIIGIVGGVRLAATLKAGAVTVSFTDPSITDDSFLDVYSSVAGVDPDMSATVFDAGTHTVTYTFDAQDQDVRIGLVVM